jgi:hypothetical protein
MTGPLGGIIHSLGDPPTASELRPKAESPGPRPPSSKPSSGGPGRRRKFFAAEILDASCLPHQLLFNADLIGRLERSGDLTKFQIYFLTITKKIRFDLPRTSVGPTGILKTWVTIGRNQSTRFVIELSKCSSVVHKLSLNPITSPISRFRLDHRSSEDRMLSVTIDFVDGTSLSHGIRPENILSSAVPENGIPQTIVYIGQSFQMIRRLQSHKRINHVLSTLRDDEELAIHLIRFKISYGGGEYRDEPWRFFLEKNAFKSAEHKAKITLLERLLIAFFRPPFNEMHTKTPLHTDQHVRRILGARKISAFALGFGMHGGALWRYTSVNQAVASEIVSYSMINPALGFQPGLSAFGADWG